MVVAALLNILKLLLFAILALIPALPQIAFLTNILTFFNNTICKGLGLFCFFIRPSTVLTGLTIAIAIFVFHHTYALIMWVVAKIPFLGIKGKG